MSEVRIPTAREAFEEWFTKGATSPRRWFPKFTFDRLLHYPDQPYRDERIQWCWMAAEASWNAATQTPEDEVKILSQIRSGMSQEMRSWDMRMDYDGPLPTEFVFDLTETQCLELLGTLRASLQSQNAQLRSALEEIEEWRKIWKGQRLGNYPSERLRLMIEKALSQDPKGGRDSG